MFLRKIGSAAWQLVFFISAVSSQDPPGNPFDMAEITVVSSTSTCYSLPIQTATAAQATYNDTIDSDLVGGLRFFLDELGKVQPLFGLRDVESETDLLFDISDPAQLGVMYPDQSAVIFNASGITVISDDCSSVLSLVLPGFYEYLIQQGGGGGGTKKSRRNPFPERRQQVQLQYPVEYFVDVVVFDQCGNAPSGPFDVFLTVGGGFECLDRASIINGVSTQGDNGVYLWTCKWPSPDSREQFCENDILRQLGYTRDDFGTAVPAPNLVSILAQGLSSLPPPSGDAAKILSRRYFRPTWTSTIKGLYALMYLQQLIDAQQLDPSNVAFRICFPYSDLKEYVWLKIRDPPGYQYLLTSVVDDTIRFSTHMQFNEQIIGTATDSCLFSAPSTFPPMPPNTNVLVCQNAEPTGTSSVPLPGRRRRADTSAPGCTPTSSSSTITINSSSTVTSTSSSTAPTTTPLFSLTVISNPPIATSCSQLPPRCDPAPYTACGYDISAGGEMEFSGCICAKNGEGRSRCFQQSGFGDVPTHCYNMGSCPGGMDCLIQDQCWALEGGGPGMCYSICTRAWETGG
ncbi:hypothetical protein B0H63DRAFT_545801 [Podospora didyma]|uniref:Uncharacterized protein n=1 Tax=Podospora didyma TaxID=330526 RepID=A0AAE0TVL7_9PEZI|nr:hypothetical protein B0H63DRAFT_545801 [Podospora didyma]